MNVYTRMLQHVWKLENLWASVLFRDWTWTPGNERRTLGLMVNAFTHEVTLLPCFSYLLPTSHPIPDN